MKKNNHQSEFDAVVSKFIVLPAGTKEYFNCLEHLRWIQSGGQTLGLNSNLELQTPSKRVVDINIKKVY